MSADPLFSSPSDLPAKLFTISEAAALLNVPEGWLRKKVSAHAVPHTRLGKHVRFTPDHLREVIAEGEAAESRPDQTARRGVSQRARRSVRTL